MRIAQVQQILAAFLPVFSMRETDDPLRMVLIKLRMRVHHFRLHPDAEAYPQFFRMADKAFQPMGQFSAVHLPVPQSRAGVIAGEPVAEPAVIQHEKLYPQVRRTFHHAVQHFFRKGKIHPLPGIQQGWPLCSSAAQAVAARPAVDAPGGLSLAVFTVRQNEGRRFKHAAAVQQIGRGSRIQSRSGKKVMIRAVPEPYPVIAGPCQRPQNNLPGILPRRTVQRDDESGASLLGGAGAGSGYQGKFMPPGHFFLTHQGLAAPGAAEAGDEVPFCAQTQLCGRSAVQADAFFPFVPNNRPLQKGVRFPVGAHVDFHPHRVGRVLPIEDGFFPVVIQFQHFPTLAFQTQGKGPVRLGHANAVLAGRIGKPCYGIRQGGIQERSIRGVFQGILRLMQPRAVIGAAHTALFIFAQGHLGGTGQQMNGIRSHDRQTWKGPVTYAGRQKCSCLIHIKGLRGRGSQWQNDRSCRTASLLLPQKGRGAEFHGFRFMHQQPAAVFRMAYDAGAAALDAESAKAPEFHQRPPPDRPRNRLQHRVQRVFRLPGSNVLPQLTLELPDKLCFIHRPPSMTCPVFPVKRQRRALIPATIPIQMPPSVPVCEFPPCPRRPAPLRFRGNACR